MAPALQRRPRRVQPVTGEEASFFLGGLGIVCIMCMYCTCACMYVCMCVLYACIVCMYCMYVRMCVCVYVCMYCIVCMLMTPRGWRLDEVRSLVTGRSRAAGRGRGVRRRRQRVGRRRRRARGNGCNRPRLPAAQPRRGTPVGGWLGEGRESKEVFVMYRYCQ